MASELERHKEHLAVVSPDEVARRLSRFRLKDIQLQALPFICQSFVLRRPFERFRPWMHPLDPVTLDDLKNWFGVPNELAKRMVNKTRAIGEDGKLWSRATQITPTALPRNRSWDFEKLDTDQRHAVKQMSKNLLYGYVSPESQSVPAVEGVVNHMLELIKRLKVEIFVAPDLIVCPDDVVEIHGVAALYFNNILIYGNGKIVTKGTTTFHAVQIKRVP